MVKVGYMPRCSIKKPTENLLEEYPYGEPLRTLSNISKFAIQHVKNIDRFKIPTEQCQAAPTRNGVRGSFNFTYPL
jgi:hypothetical protein